jgi:hypothetical protein
MCRFHCGRKKWHHSGIWHTWRKLDTRIGTTTHLGLQLHWNRLFDDVAASREAILIDLPIHFSDAPIGNAAPISEEIFGVPARVRRPFTVGTLISKWLAIFFAKANGYLEKKFDKTSPKIIKGLPALFLLSQDVSPSLKRRNHCFTVGRDTARSPRVPRKWEWIALFPWSCSQRNLMRKRCSRSSISLSGPHADRIVARNDRFWPTVRLVWD